MRWPPWIHLAAAAVWIGPINLHAQIPLQRVETSPEIVNGTESKSADVMAWPVPGDGGLHAAVFQLDQLLSAKRVRVTFAFDEGACFGEFALFATTDTQPGLDGQWQPMFPVVLTSPSANIHRTGSRVRFTGDAGPSLAVEASLPMDDVTGLKVEVYTTSRPGRPAHLKRLSLARVNLPTSNIAVGCPVTSSRPMADDSPAEFLTDGLRDTFARPAESDSGTSFHLDIDLKRQRTLDHIRLRLLPDSDPSIPVTDIKLELFDQPPVPQTLPVWTAFHRPDTSPEEPEGEFETARGVLWASDGEGVFAGRYLRISSDSHAAALPPLAEVEVYETLLPAGVSMQAGDSALQNDESFVVPPNAPWLTFAIQRPVLPEPVQLPMHWRIGGFQEKWIAITQSREAECRAPPPGDYEFQARVRHTDDIWESAKLRVPLIVPVPFWERRGVLTSVTALSAILAAGLAWFLSSRIMSRRVAELERHQELANERTRIARDMHDAVGSQLTQLTVLHEIVAEELGLDTDSRSRLRQLTDTARSSVAALDAVVWAVNPGNDNLAHMAGYLCQVASDYLVPLGIACRQDVPSDWPDLHVPSQTRHAFHLAFQEALQNVVKHAQATEVSLTMRYADGTFTTTIADNGVGLPDDLSGIEKNGLDNMQARLYALGGSCRVQSRPKGGTIVELQIPLPT